MAREQIAALKTLNMDYYPRESHVATFRDPWSFPVLFHPACSNLVRHHIADLAQKVCHYSHNAPALLMVPDCCCLRLPWRVSYHPLLPTPQPSPNTRITHPLLYNSARSPRRDRHVRAMERKLSAAKQSSARCAVRGRPVDGSHRSFHSRIHLRGHGS